MGNETNFYLGFVYLIRFIKRQNCANIRNLIIDREIFSRFDKANAATN